MLKITSQLKSKNNWLKWKANVITVNCRLKALDVYIFVTGFKRAYKQRGLYSRGIITGIEKVLRTKLQHCFLIKSQTS